MDFLTLLFSSKDPQRLAPSMARVHAHLIREQGLNVQHFDMLAGHLDDALAELDAALHELAEPQVRPSLLGLVSRVLMEECMRRCMSWPSIRCAHAPRAIRLFS